MEYEEIIAGVLSLLNRSAAGELLPDDLDYIATHVSRRFANNRESISSLSTKLLVRTHLDSLCDLNLNLEKLYRQGAGRKEGGGND